MTQGISVSYYARVNSFKFRNILEKHPAVSALYDRAVALIDQSVFKDKITPSIWFSDKTFWMSLTSQDLSHDHLDFFARHQKEWEELVNLLSAEKVTIE